jgi:hypothetical protein
MRSTDFMATSGLVHYNPDMVRIRHELCVDQRTRVGRRDAGQTNQSLRARVVDRHRDVDGLNDVLGHQTVGERERAGDDGAAGGRDAFAPELGAKVEEDFGAVLADVPGSQGITAARRDALAHTVGGLSARATSPARRRSSGRRSAPVRPSRPAFRVRASVRTPGSTLAGGSVILEVRLAVAATGK